MAAQQLSPALHAPAHPMAKPGFGKRSAPDQEPRRARDFAHLPKREAAVAGYIDRLPDGADISIKALARELEGYGQCAIGTVLRRLSEAGHLRRVRRDVQDAEGARWVFRTFFTRTPRPDAWWAAFLGGDVPQSGLADPAPVQEPEARGHDALARLVHRHPQLALSAAECEALAALAGEWFRRGATEAQLVRAVASMLPDPVRHPFGFVQNRLVKRLPPEPPAPVRGTYVMECTDCQAPGTPQSLSGGLCRICRSEPYVRPDDGRLPAEVVGGKAERLRNTVRTHKLHWAR
ncbi:hypothetical protein AR457_15265 [Streptomyces agglomeratus]|uniref:Uncharacterized protein n=1 Tax=Streptomyces agglomeratus TaxID=285458 RepID=A0A1E5P8B7_9ACTN|nr:hypothetical protein [Streptomyces agglomeratus]OEJ25624.1 hypothetical protein AS594_15080 [Streptomyces agglomeratus]OEJ40337.1 hypothetical protein BGK70_21390 [Streptomyces agglomeratus]OEJ45285.1 hypothetical protein AR457_15265 [Streptomyces agglomeratus]OEJ52887.1 hypothetical protein BGK72_21030 [Streptomyces agglomeratus]